MSNDYSAEAVEGEYSDEQLESSEVRGGKGGSDDAEYALPGEAPFFQVEPESSFWARCRFLTTVTREDVQKNIGLIRSYPRPGSEKEREELEEVRKLQARAHDADYFEEHHRSRLSAFLQDERYIQRPPEGATLNSRGNPENGTPGTPIIRYGAELATLFEAETPGLWHQHVFNVILNSPASPDGDGPLLRQVLSPTRQSLIWHALYTAIDSALDAVWHYKWLATNLPRVAFRRRPWEADHEPILYDYQVRYDSDGNILRRDVLKDAPQPTPGTPRHPAYGSGHSTYSAAASYVLSCLLPPQYRTDLRKLADNIGEARLWGGVHWRTDHTFGQQIGVTVGKLVIRQLNRSGISPNASMHIEPPMRAVLERQASAFANNCGRANNDFCAAQHTAENMQGRQG